MEKATLYHIHRHNQFDDIWNSSDTIMIDDTYQSNLYSEIKQFEQYLINKWGTYELDIIIKILERLVLESSNDLNEQKNTKHILNNMYILRREQALEKGRILYASDIPSRFHSLFLTDYNNLSYWTNLVGNNDYDIFELKCDGNLFVTSDELAPNFLLEFDKQVELSKLYWKPNVKEKLLKKEYLFQGNGRIIH